MLGWIRPTERRADFRHTILGEMIGEEFVQDERLTNGLLRECLLSICFPNPATENVGITNHRPMSWLLRLAASLDGVITRHEMIVGLLAVEDDLLDGAFEDAVDRVKRARGHRHSLKDLVKAEAKRFSIKVVTLENYTRFPVGVLKSSDIGWASSDRLSGLYEGPTEALVLSPLGLDTARRLAVARDVREGELSDFTLEQRAAFSNYGYYAMMVRSGVDPATINEQLVTSRTGAYAILDRLAIPDDVDALLYSPFQQAPQDVLNEASAE